MPRSLLFALALACATAAGCRAPAVTFPVVQLVGPVPTDAPVGRYDTDGNGRADFFTFADETGRITRVGYANAGDGDQPASIVALDEIPLANSRHLVIILDGFSYGLVADYYRQGGLRLMHPPSRVIAPYPTMTDLALEDILSYIPARGFESKFYNRLENRMSGGVDEYLEGFNQPYNDLLDYRANLLYDAIGYVKPRMVFRKEINDIKRQFDKRRGEELVAYIVSTAGMSTALGAAGQLEVLHTIDRLIHQVVAETHGLVKVTLLSDHGHGYSNPKRLDLEAFLKGRGWKVRDRINGPRDVVLPAFGLVHYASLCTSQPAQLAADMTTCHGVEIVSYAQGQDVVVLDCTGGRAVISRRDDSYRYTPTAGDPLKLADTLAALPADAEGFRDGAALMRATIDHCYPDALHRLHRAHFGLVEQPPDVIVSLSDEFFWGREIFSALTTTASTHGSLNRSNSVTFIMSTLDPLPDIIRSRQIGENLRKLTGKPFPMGRN